MIKINEITTGATVSIQTKFTVKKVNKKSVLVEDAKGNTHRISDKDFSKFRVAPTTGVTTPQPKTTKSTSREALPSLRGRYPKWANSTPKKNFVRAERAEGNTATPATYAEYRTFLKEKRA